MTAEATSSSKPRRNRIIAIIAGAITVTAVVASFASGYLGLGWQWLRPAAELLLLAELVGLIVLERHQLFEPVNAKVDDIKADTSDLRAMLRTVAQQISAAGQVTVAVGPRETLQLRTRLVREALARDQEGPQILRSALLSGGGVVLQDSRELGDELQAFYRTVSEFQLLPGSPANARGHRWSQRLIFAWSTMDNFERGVQLLTSMFAEAEVLNAEIKILVRLRPEALLSPNMITDRAVFLAYSDEAAPFRWGLALQGQQYVTLFTRWFDDRWSAIPDSYLIYSRSGLNQKAVDRIRNGLEAAEASDERRTA
jgi:hypothetical protein